MRYLVLLIALLMSCASAPKKPEPKFLENKNRIYANPMVEAQYESSVKIKVHCESEFDSGSMGGSGTAIAGDQVVTATHVLACEEFGMELKKIEVWRRDGTKAVARIKTKIPMAIADVSVLEVPLSTFFPRYAEMSYEYPEIGDVVCLMAANPSKFGTRGCGPVQSYHVGLGWGGYGAFAYDLKSMSGTSGGGIYNEAGFLIGVHVGVEVYRNNNGTEVHWPFAYALKWAKPLFD